MHTWRTPGRDDIWAPVSEIVVDFIWREGCSYRESPGVKEQLDGLAGEDTYPQTWQPEIRPWDVHGCPLSSTNAHPQISGLWLTLQSAALCQRGRVNRGATGLDCLFRKISALVAWRLEAENCEEEAGMREDTGLTAEPKLWAAQPRQITSLLPLFPCLQNGQNAFIYLMQVLWNIKEIHTT